MTNEPAAAVPPRTLGAASVWPWLVPALAALGLVLAELRAIQALLYAWDHRPMYSYGYLVPLISGVLAWSQRDTLAALPRRWQALPAAPWLLAWAAFIVSGHFSGVVLLEQLAILPGVSALIVLVWGHAGLRTLWAAVAYLLLMIPIWDAFTEPLHGRFQLMSATIGVQLLQQLGVPVHQDRTFIYLPSMAIEVARACSGVNYLIAVLALGLPLSYLKLRSPWRGIALVGAAVAVAILSNGLRVALIGLLVYLDIGSPLHGPAHLLHGLFVAAIGHVTLFVGLWWLRRQEDGAPDAVPPSTARPRSPLAAPAISSVLAVSMVFWGGATLVYAVKPIPRPLMGTLLLPAAMDAYVAAAVPPEPLTYWPNADTGAAMRYRRPGRSVDVHVAYYAVQAQDRELVNHLALGLHAQARRLTVDSRSGPFAVNVARVDRDGRSRLICFWYEVNGGAEAGATQARLSTLWSAVRERATSGAAVSLVTEIDVTGGESAAAEALLGVAGRFRPLIAEQLSATTASTVAARAVGP